MSWVSRFEAAEEYYVVRSQVDGQEVGIRYPTAQEALDFVASLQAVCVSRETPTVTPIKATR